MTTIEGVLEILQKNILPHKDRTQNYLRRPIFDLTFAESGVVATITKIKSRKLAPNDIFF